VAQALAGEINAADYASAGAPYGLQATANGAELTITTTTGGYDANFIELLAVTSGGGIGTTQPTLVLSGGASTATLHVALDFSALGLTDVQQMWLTFAPRLEYAGAMTMQEWSATFSNWTVGGDASVQTLSVPGPGSQWIGCVDTACQFAGTWTLEDGFYYGGQARVGAAGASVKVRYYNAAVHDVWLAAEVNADGGTVTARLDGTTTAASYSTLGAGTAVVQTQRLFANVAAGWHTVTIVVSGGTLTYDHVIVSVPTTDVPSMAAQSDLSAAFDYSTDHTYKLPPARIAWMLGKLGLQGPVNQYAGIFWWNQRTNTGAVLGSATVDFSAGFQAQDQIFLNLGGQVCGKTVLPTDTPQTIAQHFAAFLNSISVGVWAEAAGATLTLHNRSADPAYVYTSVAWVERAGAFYEFLPTGGYGLGAALVSLGGTYAAGDQVTVTVGAAPFARTIAAGDTPASVANALAQAINASAAGVTAWVANPANGDTPLTVGFDVALAIANRSGDAGNDPSITVQAQTSGTGHAALSGTLAAANAGTWQIDPAQDPPLNAGARAWHQDFYTQCAAAGLEVTTACSMELVNPPASYAALFSDGTAAMTDEEFGGLFSTQCAFSSAMLGYQTRVYTWLAQAQAAAGLTPVLQCGEFCWWYFAHPAPWVEFPFSASGNGTRHFIGVDGRVYQHTEDSPAGESGADVANALITAVNAARDAEVTASVGPAAWIVRLTARTPGPQTIAISADAGSQTLRYPGGMAYYDAETMAQAQTALGRPLYEFLTPNDDPTVNGSADATFLRDRLRDYCASITTAVKAAVPGTRFEILYPGDVNAPVPTGVNQLGGALNHFVNLPPEWAAPGGSGFDRFKVEGLDYGTSNRSLDLALAVLELPLELGWPANLVSSVTPVYRPGYAWVQEVLKARELRLRAITLWAFDHVNLFGLDVRVPNARLSYYVA
jgi:hypothetical protein